MENKNTLEVETTTKRNIDIENLKSVIVSALEGGSNYWYYIEEIYRPKGYTKENSFYCDIPFLDGGYIQFLTKNETLNGYELSKETYRLNLKSIVKGIQLLEKAVYSNGKRHRFADYILKEKWIEMDAEFGDYFLQLCLFGKIIYG